MPQFSDRSKKNLEEAHPDLQTLFNEVIKYFDCLVIDGHRGQEEQDKAYHEGTSTLKFPQSKHNKSPSMAVDVIPYPVDWKDAERFIYFGGFVMGIARMMYEKCIIDNPIRWGGDWDNDKELKDHSFIDYPHFEINR